MLAILPPTNMLNQGPYSVPDSADPDHHSEQDFQYDVEIVQQPVHARAMGWSQKVNSRRPVDPPPVINFTVRNKDNQIVTHQITNVFILHTSLIELHSKDDPNNANAGTVNPQGITGSTIVSLAHIRNPPPGRFFFLVHDISIRQEGRYRLLFNVYEAISEKGLVKHRARTTSHPFVVYSPKSFPGLEISSDLIKEIALQGCRVRVRKESKAKRKRSRISDELKSDLGTSMSPMGGPICYYDPSALISYTAGQALYRTQPLHHSLQPALRPALQPAIPPTLQQAVQPSLQPSQQLSQLQIPMQQQQAQPLPQISQPLQQQATHHRLQPQPVQPLQSQYLHHHSDGYNDMSRYSRPLQMPPLTVPNVSQSQGSMSNQPMSNQPMSNQPMSNQSMSNQSISSQSISTQSLSGHSAGPTSTPPTPYSQQSAYIQSSLPSQYMQNMVRPDGYSQHPQVPQQQPPTPISTDQSRMSFASTSSSSGQYFQTQPNQAPPLRYGHYPRSYGEDYHGDDGYHQKAAAPDGTTYSVADGETLYYEQPFRRDYTM